MVGEKAETDATVAGVPQIEVTPEMIVTSETIVRSAFEMAYQRWRDRLCEQDLNGMPWADATGDDLFQEFCREIRFAAPRLGQQQSN